MKRRDFIKTSAVGAALISTSGLYFSCGKTNPYKIGQIDCFQPNQEIPVIKDVDVFIAGGSTAAVSAAVQIAKEGGSVFLVTDHPYLGEDVCGTFNYWDVGTPETGLAKVLFKDKSPRNPIFYKRALDNALLDQNIDFLYSSFVTDIQSDSEGNVSAVVISNRSGQQAIKAKALIDATQHGTMARAANLNWKLHNMDRRVFNYRVVGNKVNKKFTAKTYKANFSLKEEPIPVLEYKMTFKSVDDSFADLQRIEQKVRDLTWTPEQMDSADDLAFIPNKSIKCKFSDIATTLKPFSTLLENFQPENTTNFYMLNSYADVSRIAAKKMMRPCDLMIIAERMGTLALNSARKQECSIPASEDFISEDSISAEAIKMTYDFIRPDYIKGDAGFVHSSLPVLGEYDVVVMGGGTAGAPAGIGAAQQGAKTLVVEYLHGLGGIGTLGLIGAYFHGYREGYSRLVDESVRQMGSKDHPRQLEPDHVWVKDWKMEYFRSELRKAGADIWFGAIGIGALVQNNSVEGVVIATPFGKGVVLAKKIIDSTGSADIAIAAGAQYRHTDKDCLAVQGAGLPPIFEDRSYTNTDWTFINDTDIFDVWRTFVSGKKKYDDGHYDVGKIPQTRERRRIVGDHEISVLDLYNNRIYSDIVSIHKSSFDTHGFTNDPFFNLKPPKGGHLDEIAYVPLRSMLPKGIENIIVTGLGASADRDAMPVIRMQPCLQSQGYTVGHLAALAVKDGVTFRKVNLRKVQEKMVKLGSLPESILTDQDNYPPTPEQMNEAVKAVPNELDLLEIVLWDTPKGLKLLRKAYQESTDKKAKLQYAHVLATYGIADGWEILADETNSIKIWDKGWNYRGMGQFGACMSPLDSMLIALGNTKKKEVLPVLSEKANLLKPDHEFSHFRAIALALENYKDKKATDILYNLLQLEGAQGHAMTTIEKSIALTDDNWTNTKVRNNSLRELILARALYRTGDKNGLGKKILKEYTKDLRGHYARHSFDVLMNS